MYSKQKQLTENKKKSNCSLWHYIHYLSIPLYSWSEQFSKHTLYKITIVVCKPPRLISLSFPRHVPIHLQCISIFPTEARCTKCLEFKVKSMAIFLSEYMGGGVSIKFMYFFFLPSKELYKKTLNFMESWFVKIKEWW